MLGTKLSFNTAFHPQSDGQSERMIQKLEDMLRACALDFEGKWDEHLPLVEFAYNNSYQATIGMPPYEALGTKLSFSMAFHPQSDGQSERMIQTLEDMLRTYALDFAGR